MTRRCSHCNSNGHNTRTCSTRSGGGGGGLRLFGVRLTDGSFITKSASMGNLSHYSAAASESPDGYHSDHPGHGSDARRRPIRNKGIPWTEEEHWQFLLGLQNLGKGDWRGISKNYVCSRTPTQVASHAQKYFIRQSNSNRKKKRTSLFDMVPEKVLASTNHGCVNKQNFDFEYQDKKSSPSEKLICSNKTLVLSSTSSSAANTNNNALPSLDLSLKPAFTNLPLQLWPPNACPRNIGDGTDTRKAPVVVQDEPIKELVGMSHLTLGETAILQNESLTFSLSVAGNP